MNRIIRPLTNKCYKSDNFLFNLQNTNTMKKYKIPSDILNTYAYVNKTREPYPKKNNIPIPTYSGLCKNSYNPTYKNKSYDNIEEYYNAYCI